MNIRTDTLRHALADLRRAVAESTDSMHAVSGIVETRDGAALRVGLCRAADGGRLLGSYEARRWVNGSREVVYWLGRVTP